MRRGKRGDEEAARRRKGPWSVDAAQAWHLLSILREPALTSLGLRMETDIPCCLGSLVPLLLGPGTPTTQRGKLRLREGACRAQAQTQDPVGLRLPSVAAGARCLGKWATVAGETPPQGAVTVCPLPVKKAIEGLLLKC